MTDLIKKYQSMVHQTIPISQYMQWSIGELKQHKITCFTNLKPNINIHSTAFAGSIYAAAMATGWTLMKAWYDSELFSQRLSHEATLLAAEASIQYSAPVNGDFSCHATIDTTCEEYTKLYQRLENKASVAFPLTIEVSCGNKVCAILKVNFVFKN